MIRDKGQGTPLFASSLLSISVVRINYFFQEVSFITIINQIYDLTFMIISSDYISFW